MQENHGDYKYKNKMTFSRDLSVPSDNFFTHENSLVGLFKRQSSPPAKAELKKDEKCQETRSETSDGHTSDGEASASTFEDNNFSDFNLNYLDCCPITNIGLGYTQSSKDINSSDAILSSNMEICDAKDCKSISDFAVSRINNNEMPGSFLICNLTTLTTQYNLWKSELPMVEPFYAVKCNPDPAILRVLATLGCGFDCATMGEIDLVLNGLGDQLNFSKTSKASNNIVYANPAKMEHMIQYAINNEVKMTVFDGEDELYKIASLKGHDKLKLLLRLTTDDKDSVCRFSKKFGCPVEEAEDLLVIAKSLGLHVAGVSFHVGSGCGDAAAYSKALEDSKTVFLLAEKLGMTPMNIVDIGGGFPGDSTIYGVDRLPDFKELASAIRSGITDFLSALQSNENKIRFIAEPGRFFVSACTSIVTKVYSRRGGKQEYQALYVDDGVYGSFNNVVYDHALPVPTKLPISTQKDSINQEVLIPTAVFGPTCDGLDQMCSLENTLLERCNVGDWLLWENQGAYTHTASFVFNGYTHIPNKIYCTL